jgi:hypothetical protein
MTRIGILDPTLVETCRELLKWKIPPRGLENVEKDPYTFGGLDGN